MVMMQPVMVVTMKGLMVQRGRRGRCGRRRRRGRIRPPRYDDDRAMRIKSHGAGRRRWRRGQRRWRRSRRAVGRRRCHQVNAAVVAVSAAVTALWGPRRWGQRVVHLFLGVQGHAEQCESGSSLCLQPGWIGGQTAADCPGSGCCCCCCYSGWRRNEATVRENASPVCPGDVGEHRSLFYPQAHLFHSMWGPNRCAFFGSLSLRCNAG